MWGKYPQNRSGQELADEWATGKASQPYEEWKAAHAQWKSNPDWSAKGKSGKSVLDKMWGQRPLGPGGEPLPPGYENMAVNRGGDVQSMIPAESIGSPAGGGGSASFGDGAWSLPPWVKPPSTNPSDDPRTKAALDLYNTQAGESAAGLQQKLQDMGLGASGASGMAMARQGREFGLGRANLLANLGESNRVFGLGAGQLALGAGQLGVSRGRLALDREAVGRGLFPPGWRNPATMSWSGY